MDDLIIYKKESFEIVGAAMEVHKILGCGFSEPIYQEAFEYELKLRNIPYIREKYYPIKYKKYLLSKNFREDFECYGQILVELKAVEELKNEFFTQSYNYLKASGLELALLINFGKTTLETKRILRKDYWDNN